MYTHGSWKDWQRLLDPDIQQCIEQSLTRDPAALALELRKHHPDWPASLMADQLKSLQKAQAKLPTWFRQRCLFPPLALEQASSEAAAQMKNTFSGKTCVDLTCGLGVDAWSLSHSFDQVWACEADPVLAALTADNMRRLGVEGLDILPREAQTILHSPPGLPPVDLIYLDPSRRDAHNRKKILLRDLTPDPTRLIPQLLRISQRVLIKLSPMFDLQEGFRLFPHADEAIVISIDGVCREVLFSLSQVRPSGTIRRTARVMRRGEIAEWQADELEPAYGTGWSFEGNWLYALDPGIIKADLIAEVLAGYTNAGPLGLTGPRGYILSERPLSGFPGPGYEIMDILPFQPRQVRKWLRQRGLSAARIHCRASALSVADIRKITGIREGEELDLFVTDCGDGRRRLYICHRA